MVKEQGSIVSSSPYGVSHELKRTAGEAGDTEGNSSSPTSPIAAFLAARPASPPERDALHELSPVRKPA